MKCFIIPILAIACLTEQTVGQVIIGSSNSAHSVFRNTPEGDPFCDQNCTDWWYLPQLQAINDEVTLPVKPIVIAIIDDGFRLTHQDIQPFLYKNPLEKPNGMDDDGNGYVDDIIGWDVADNDADVSFPLNRAKDYYHGTYLAGIIAKTLTHVFGPNASNYFKILPIKGLSDNAGYLYMADGYNSLDYAARMNADIICMAWGANVIQNEEKEKVTNLQEKNITMLASAGNMSNGLDQFPAALPGVISVAAIDEQNKRVDVSTIGRFVDISAPGNHICGASVLGDDQYLSCKGTSPAVAYASAIAAIVKLFQPDYTPEEIENILKQTSIPIDEYNLSYAGRLGAGKIDVEHLLKYLQSPGTSTFQLLHPEGMLPLNGNGKELKTWTIRPKGAYHAIEFLLDIPPQIKLNNTVLSISGAIGRDTLIKLTDWPKGSTYSIQGSEATITWNPKQAPKNINAKLYFEVVPLDSSQLYCKETQYLYDESGIIEDGSGPNPYVNLTACKWQISAPAGKEIELKFLDMDTESGVDHLMIFDGTSAIPEFMIARLSGNAIPPVFNTHTNEVLLFFTTDGKHTGQGWKLEYSFK